LAKRRGLGNGMKGAGDEETRQKNKGDGPNGKENNKTGEKIVGQKGKRETTPVKVLDTPTT